VLSRALTRRLQRLRELRRLLVHEYATATAEQVHESALIVAGNFTPFYDAYREWIARGLRAEPEKLKRPRSKGGTSPTSERE
jgi:uncharacterized protein YutE (UPF0331/DUF86 family)